MIFFLEKLSLVPETSAPKEHFKLVFGSGTSDLAKIRPLKNWTPAINWKSSLYGNFHPNTATANRPIAPDAPQPPVHPHAVAGGRRVWKCHFRGWQHLRAVKIFPLARAATYGPKRKRALFFYKKRADLALSR